ncbi:hypothetical protein GH714_016834 [Hevea brasiliensis]|uniref:Uncharacterized protein n=1 Tax=Hevea brasiliensis TaxID=3981 RepID=A0A6A6ND76_HEVBR|nr:hypothetical protein GH714_016834 [Hevea brasiliensis]
MRRRGWLKEINSTPNLIHGVARDAKVRIRDWHGTLDFFVVTMDDYQCILRVEFVDRAKANPMIFANSMCIMDGGGATTREKVGCARENVVARSPREESSPRQEGPRRHHSRKSRRKCKAEGRASALSHRDKGGTAGAQLEQARGNHAGHVGRHGRRLPTEGGSVGVNPCGAKGRCITGRQYLRESIFGANRSTGKQESCWKEQAKMRFRWARGVLGTYWACGPYGSSRRADEAQNEVHRVGASAQESLGTHRNEVQT